MIHLLMLQKGCLARFANHSCNPNAYVDKWVVGDKLRMGIFAKEELKKVKKLHLIIMLIDTELNLNLVIVVNQIVLNLWVVKLKQMLLYYYLKF